MKASTSQLQLTRSADYAVRAMIHLATLPGAERTMLPALATAIEAPSSFLSKVLQALSHAGLISSRRGPVGGFAICPEGLRASIREVIEAVDGTIRLNVCLRSGRSCNRKSWCPAHVVWMRAQAAMLEVLDAAIVADLAATVNAQAMRGLPRNPDRMPIKPSKQESDRPFGANLLSQ
jgi:Rrf2 family protein